MSKHPAQPGVTVTVTQIDEAGAVAQRETFNMKCLDEMQAEKLYRIRRDQNRAASEWPAQALIDANER